MSPLKWPSDLVKRVELKDGAVLLQKMFKNPRFWGEMKEAHISLATRYDRTAEDCDDRPTTGELAVLGKFVEDTFGDLAKVQEELDFSEVLAGGSGEA